MAFFGASGKTSVSLGGKICTSKTKPSTPFGTRKLVFLKVGLSRCHITL